MKFLIDGHANRVQLRSEQWAEGVAGQLITPLTGDRRGHDTFAIDNGAYTSFNEKRFHSILRREFTVKEQCLFVALPDKVGCHATTLILYEDYYSLLNGWKRAFVCQDGFDCYPNEYDAIFIGGTNKFKDSKEALEIVTASLRAGKHTHVGRVNTYDRFIRFHEIGAHTCDGSGVSRYDHMLPRIKELMNG